MADASATPRESRLNPFTKSAQGGRVLSAIQMPFFRFRTPRGFGILTTTGRRTGKPRPKCVRVIRDGDRAFLVVLGPALLDTPKHEGVSAWLHNIRANPLVTLKLHDGTVVGTAREIVDSAELHAARHTYTTAVNNFDHAEFVFHIARRPSRERIQNLHRHWFDRGIPVAIDLERT